MDGVVFFVHFFVVWINWYYNSMKLYNININVLHLKYIVISFMIYKCYIYIT